jgi:Xaa-Pro dipeptidase
LIRKDHPAVLVLPEFERAKAEGAAIPLETVAYPEDPMLWPEAFSDAAERLHLSGARVGVEPLRMRVLELRYLEAAEPGARYVASAETFDSLRLLKDPGEIEAMRKAVAIAERALIDTLPKVRAGMTEKDVAAELVLHLLRGGSESSLPFDPIVASGPNSANPHWATGERRLAPGDLLIIDWGATADGYISDLTRTFSLGSPDKESARIHSAVAEANAAGCAAVRPGATCGSVDDATRGVIDGAGYGPYFLHRTGHGIGVEAHEAPYIRGDNVQRLEPGMTFTVEPGIYLQGRGGVRIEDNVVVTPSGCDVLTILPRELQVLAS